MFQCGKLPRVPSMSELPSYQETVLMNKVIEATYEYMVHIKSEWLPRFSKETANYVINKHSIYYDIIFGKKSCSSELHKETYNKLVLLTHPDKCNLPNVTQLFNLVSDYYTSNDTDSLQKMLEWWNTYGSFEGFEDSINGTNTKSIVKITDADELSIEDKRTLITRWQSELWYVWYISSTSSIIRDVYMPHEEYIEKYKDT